MTALDTALAPTAPSASESRLSTSEQALIERFEHWSGTYFLALFAGRLFDQTLVPEVAAGIEWTGRIRYSPFGRAGRTAASDQLAWWGDQETRQREHERLWQLHRDVRGTSPEGVRFSALAPEAWNWILLSTGFFYLNSFRAVVGDRLDQQDLQILWAHLTHRVDGLQLPGSQRLPERYDDAVALYDATIATKAQRTDIFNHVTSHLRRPPAPDNVPAILRPVIAMVGTVLIRPLAILSIGITEPGVRTIGEHRWTQRHQAEFDVYIGAIRIAQRLLPERLIYTPLAYNRSRYRKIVGRYEQVGLQSFVPGAERGCPMGH